MTVLLSIDHDDARPLYRQVAASVRRAVVAGELAPGSSLPTTRDAAAALGVNPETIQRAYRQLADEGLVVARVGRGTRIHPDVDLDELGLDDAIASLLARGRHLGLAREDLAQRILLADDP